MEICKELTFCGNGKAEFLRGHKFECGTYDFASAIKLRAAVVLSTQLSQYHDTFTNVKYRKRMVLEDRWDIEFESEVTTGKGLTDCGWYPTRPKHTRADKYIGVKNLFIETEICYKKLLGTEAEGLLKAGQNRVYENTALNEKIVSSIITSAARQTDELKLYGDYGSAHKRLAHYDGWVKRIALAQDTNKYETVKWVFNNLAATDFVEGWAGGERIVVPFNTDTTTTLADVAAVIGAYTDAFGEPLYTVVVDANEQSLVVISNHIEKYNVHDVNIDLHVTDGTGVPRGSNCPNQAGTGTVAFTIVQEAILGDVPIIIPKMTPTKDNIIDFWSEFYLKVTARLPEAFDDPELAKKFKIFVPHNIYSMTKLATTMITSEVKGILGIESSSPFDLPLVPVRQLKNNDIIATFTDNLLFATDLESDLGDVDMWVDKECELVKFRMAAAQGTQIGRFAEIITNICIDDYAFGAPEPDTLEGLNCTKPLSSNESPIGNEAKAKVSVSGPDMTLTSLSTVKPDDSIRGYEWSIVYADGTEEQPGVQAESVVVQPSQSKGMVILLVVYVSGEEKTVYTRFDGVEVVSES